ncbi:UDP-N-acetylmuramate-alanine ligase [Candidatus Liberibacter americanus str. Sao Paulo]|uniref:UDP-N-acetylmuramate--L-alanine ligase n=2 Tax=Candidatus Liberibacter americanus TaxID=309868 RepID=U6B7Y4_9HYPH|nr:UDP-N-acetylmuramate-alanine ligase [Candidatus Liberibacter americanus str. Sao Paulo]EMS36004.1 UDP-N-acetylmuramate--L-alanine ligase [Candidatus Liberibacter americanus PW_SP]
MLPEGIGLIHFIGIGGIGMSGIAEVLHNTGYKVQGSDIYLGANVVRLREKGIEVFIGHKSENIGDASVIVVSTAIDSNNLECISARERNIPIISRAEMLAAIMNLRRSIAISGTNGKTTTTSIIATLLDMGNLDPTVINGGIINSYGTNSKIGKGEWIVAEADESDASFLKLPADIAVVTNIYPEHLDYYGNFDAVRSAFSQFINNIPFYGFGVLYFDNPDVRNLIPNIKNRQIITYGNNPQADVYYYNIRKFSDHTVFDIAIRGKAISNHVEIKDCVLYMIGKHNVANASAAITIAYKLGVSLENITKGLAAFAGVKRRFTPVGVWKNIHFFDDYGHHPIEISSVLTAARDVCNRKVIAIHQPHRYSRLESLFDQFITCFDVADVLFVTPVYEAGEKKIKGITSQQLVKRISKNGHNAAYYVDSLDFLVKKISEIVKSGDFVIFFGAGSISQWASVFVSKIQNIQ